MSRFSFHRLPLRALAIVFAVATTLYSAAWMYYIRQDPQSRLGIDAEFSRSERALVINGVIENTGAASAGLRAGDRIVGIDGRPLEAPDAFDEVLWKNPPGTTISLEVRRAGAPRPLRLRAVLSPRPPEAPSLAQRIATELVSSFPLPFLAVGFTVLFLRPQDRNAWLLALMFAGFVAVAPIFEYEPIIHPNIRGFVLAYKVIFHGIVGAVFYYFFAVFPVSSPLDRRVPWLKTLLLAGAVAIAVPAGLWVLWAGRSRPLLELADLRGTGLLWALLGYFFGAFGLGFASLLSNGLRAPTAEARRRIRVIVWGTVAGVLPFTLLGAAAVYARKEPYEFPFWVWAPCVMAVFLLPLSFGYAVVKHRVLEIPVLLKRSVRYLLVQRGVFVFWVFLGTPALTFFSARQFSRLFATQAEVSVGLGMAFGVLLTLVSILGGKRFNERLDRAFFRSAYDARKILEDLAQKTRTATSRQELAELMERHLEEALHPIHLAIYLESPEGLLHAVRGRVPAELPTLERSSPLLVELARRGQPLEVPLSEGRATEGFAAVAPLQAECLVPLLGRDHRLVGLLALGPRLSEEPYSGEDRRLLSSIANQAGVALENIHLAETIAERMEAERRITLEMDIARQVQRRLLPQSIIPMKTLEYAAECIQARAVGGDCYDFLDLGPRELGLVLGDVSGKSISAALLMANLQASLRSRSALALREPSRLLRSVNDLLLETTEPQHYVTLFFATYDDASRKLRYVNCGHNPPLLLRREESVERLSATATILGMFADWTCQVEAVELAPGDTLVLYTDGVVEARSAEGEEFGEARLLQATRPHGGEPVGTILERIVRAVREFSPGEQADDLTLVVARVR